MQDRCLAGLTYPLKVSTNRRHLVDQNDAPILIHGDTAWSLIAGLTASEVEEYLANRQRKGFNALIVNLIEHMFKGPVNRYGEGPFTTPEDLSTPNERYFAYADWVIQKATEYGILLLLAPIYLGYKKPIHDADEGWYYEALASGPSKCLEYGRYLGRRYAHCEHIVWLMGGDRNPGAALPHVEAVTQGIREYASQALFSAHCAPENSAVAHYGSSDWLHLNTTYTYEIVHRKLLADYQHTPVMPFVLVESTYEGEHNASAVQIRRQAYWAILCGAAGQFLGNRPIWLFDPGWQAALDATGSQDMVHLRALFTSRAWYTLVPDQAHQIVTGGLGEFRGLDYLAAALTEDRSTLIAYMPSRRTITVDLSRLSGERVNAWWFDPCTGEAKCVGTYTTHGTQAFSPPAEQDWVLVLDDQARRFPAPGTLRIAQEMRPS
jgi:hypothetical protein